jgi:uncharacterized protein (DUF58 family)
MLTQDTIRKIRRIELRTRKLVNTAFSGVYHAAFKGHGIEFDSVRPYQPGDDVRSIDWNVTARAGEAFVKQYIEERELTVMLLLDASASSFFGSTQSRKHDMAAELGSVLAYSAIANQDKVGLLVFSDQIERYVPPRKGRNHILRLIRDLLAVQPSGKGTDIALALQAANRLLKQRAIIFLISDFLDSVDRYFNDLSIISRRHDLIAVVFTDPLEKSWREVGLVALQDAETGERRWVDTSFPGWSQAFESRAQDLKLDRNEAFNRAGADRIEVQSGEDYIPALMSFFHRRMRR